MQAANSVGSLTSIPRQLAATTGDTSRLAELSPICSRIAFNSRRVFSSTFVPTYGSLPAMLTALAAPPGVRSGSEPSKRSQGYSIGVSLRSECILVNIYPAPLDVVLTRMHFDRGKGVQ